MGSLNYVKSCAYDELNSRKFEPQNIILLEFRRRQCFNRIRISDFDKNSTKKYLKNLKEYN
jgi:hypothetical protein